MMVDETDDMVDCETDIKFIFLLSHLIYHLPSLFSLKSTVPGPIYSPNQVNEMVDRETDN